MPKFKIYDKTYEADSPDGARAMFLAENKPGFLEGLVSHFGQGLSLGAADEMTAGLDKLRGKDYTQSMRSQQARRDAFAAENPVSAGLATGAGALMPVAASVLGGSLGGPPGAVAAGAATGGRALQLTRAALGGQGSPVPVNTIMGGVTQGAKVGLPVGGITGYMSADPEASGGRTEGTAYGAAGGAAFGGALGGAIQAGQQAAQAVRPVLERTANALRQPALSKYPRRVFPEVAPSMNPTSAEEKVLTALLRSGVSPEDAAVRLQQAREAGVPLGLVDVGGNATQRLGRSTRTLPGQGSTIMDGALEERAAGQSGRVVNFLEQGMGARTTGNSGQTVDALIDQARRDSRPLYRQLDRLPPVNDAQVLEQFRTPMAQRVFQQRDQTLVNMGQPPRGLYDADGTLTRPPTFDEVNYLKRLIDGDLSPSAQRTGRPSMSGLNSAEDESRRLMEDMRRQLLIGADSAPGGQTYAQARAAYAGPAQAKDAYETGLAMPNKATTLQDVISSIDGTSPQFYRQGVVEALRGKVDSMPDLSSQPNRVRAVAGNATDRAKLNAAALPDQRALLRQRLDLENQGAQTNNFVRSGSQTADKLAEGADDVAGDLVRQSVSNGPVAALRAQGLAYLNTLRGAVGEQTRAEVARQLTNFNDPAAQQVFLRRLSELQQRGQLNAETVQRAAQAATNTNEVR